MIVSAVYRTSCKVYDHVEDEVKRGVDDDRYEYSAGTVSRNISRKDKYHVECHEQYTVVYQTFEQLFYLQLFIHKLGERNYKSERKDKRELSECNGLRVKTAHSRKSVEHYKDKNCVAATRKKHFMYSSHVILLDVYSIHNHFIIYNRNFQGANRNFNKKRLNFLKRARAVSECRSDNKKIQF